MNYKALSPTLPSMTPNRISEEFINPCHKIRQVRILCNHDLVNAGSVLENVRERLQSVSCDIRVSNTPRDSKVVICKGINL